VAANEGHAGTVAADVLGAGSFRQAHLTGANGVALELFEFERPAPGRSGIFHVCLVPPNLERTAARIAASGGRRTSRIWQLFPGEPHRTCYCEDPFGNTIELYSHSHERTWSNRK
jgi:catechol-2,3-dioxygenase